MTNNTFFIFDDFLKYFDILNFRNNALFIEALTHSSILKIKLNNNIKQSNERLEFLGDSILNLCISQMLFKKFQNDSDAALSKKKSFLISREICNKVAHDIKLESEILISNSINKEKIFQTSILSCACEAILGAIFLIYGIHKIYQIIEYLFLPYLSDFEDDVKMKLQEICQKKYGQLPNYKIISTSGLDHEKIFKVAVYIDSFYTVGIDFKKKLAEKKAAYSMLKIIS